MVKNRYDETIPSKTVGKRRLYFDHCPSCGKEIWRPHYSLGKRCFDCGSKRILLDRPYKMSNDLGHQWTQNVVLYQDKCPKCERELWRRRNKIGKLCPDCGRRAGKLSGESNGFWRGGRKNRSDGYVMVKLSKDDPYYSMATPQGYVLEHRYVMAKKLGRCLEEWEIVHHLNSKRNDNRPENLDILPDRNTNILISRLQARVSELEKRVTMLEAELVLRNAIPL